jgi:hypothetical protein
MSLSEMNNWPLEYPDMDADLLSFAAVNGFYFHTVS